jgi:hypothetical protein
MIETDANTKGGAPMVGGLMTDDAMAERCKVE